MDFEKASNNLQRKSLQKVSSQMRPNFFVSFSAPYNLNVDINFILQASKLGYIPHSATKGAECNAM